MIPNRVTDCSQPGCMEMVGIMQSIPVIRSPQTINYGLFEAIGTFSPQLIRTDARCFLRKQCDGANCKPQSTTSTSREIFCSIVSPLIFLIYLIFDCHGQLYQTVTQGDKAKRLTCAQTATYVQVSYCMLVGSRAGQGTTVHDARE